MTDEEKHKRFDVVIGNPPYQQEAHGDSTRAEPIYPEFMSNAYKISKITELITPARFLFNAGQTSKKWNKQMLNDKHLKVLYYEHDSSKVFDNTDIKGGVTVTLHDNTKDIGPISVFTPYSELQHTLKKVQDKMPESFTKLVSSSGLYRFSKLIFDEHPDISNLSGAGTGSKITSKIFSKASSIFTDERKSSNDLQIIGLINNKRSYRFINEKYIEENNFINKYKVFVPKANGSGKLGEQLSSPIIATPNEIATDTFISIGPVDSKIEASNLLKYIKSKFARALLGIKKVTQDNPKSTWSCIPIQDFTDNSDIDWTKSISEIDQQLYKKYDLSQDEIDFIESHVKEMD